MSILKKTALATATAAVFASVPAVAYEAGDMMLRVGAAGVYPTGDSDNITPIDPNAKVEADDAWSLGITFSYMFTDNIGVDPTEVYVVYNKNGGSNVTIPMSALGGDLFSAGIPGPAGTCLNKWGRARFPCFLPACANSILAGLRRPATVVAARRIGYKYLNRLRVTARIEMALPRGIEPLLPA